MAVEVSGEPRSMTSSFSTKLTFSRIEFMNWVSRRNTVSSMPRLTNSNLDGFRKRPMSASMHEHLFMSSHADVGSPAIVASSIYQTLKLDFMDSRSLHNIFLFI